MQVISNIHMKKEACFRRPLSEKMFFKIYEAFDEWLELGDFTSCLTGEVGDLFIANKSVLEMPYPM